MAGSSRPVREAVALVVRHPTDPDRVLAVLRPPDDPELPDVWGLPAASRRPGESWADAARRAAREKLGVSLRVGRELAHGTAERPAYTLAMRLLEGEIADGEPRVPQPYPEVTQYRAWRWATPDLLAPAADLGSLCCRLFLETRADQG